MNVFSRLLSYIRSLFTATPSINEDSLTSTITQPVSSADSSIVLHSSPFRKRNSSWADMPAISPDTHLPIPHPNLSTYLSDKMLESGAEISSIITTISEIRG